MAEVNDSCDEATTAKTAKEKIDEMKFIQKQRERKHGIDVYSLAIGELETKTITKAEQIDNDPWKKKTGGLVDMKVMKERRGNEIVTSMTSNFARETNQRDEDAEMQKFIDDQIELKKLAEKQKEELNDGKSNVDTKQISDVNKFKRPEDALFDLPKYLIENASKHRSEESLSEQMLSGIPEVDLGVSERIRNIEETERAKQTHATSGTSSSSTQLISGNRFTKTTTSSSDLQYAGSVNFVQHKRFDDTLINPDHMVKRRVQRPNTAQAATDNQPVVGDAPKHELLQLASKTEAANQASYKKHTKTSKGPKPNARRQYHVTTNMNEEAPENESLGKMCAPGVDISKLQTGAAATSTAKETDPAKKPQKRAPTEKASDDYCLERFKKNMRHSRSSKIKIA